MCHFTKEKNLRFSSVSFLWGKQQYLCKLQTFPTSITDKIQFWIGLTATRTKERENNRNYERYNGFVMKTNSMIITRQHRGAVTAIIGLPIFLRFLSTSRIYMLSFLGTEKSRYRLPKHRDKLTVNICVCI